MFLRLPSGRKKGYEIAKSNIELCPLFIFGLSGLNPFDYDDNDVDKTVFKPVEKDLHSLAHSVSPIKNVPGDILQSKKIKYVKKKNY